MNALIVYSKYTKKEKIKLFFGKIKKYNVSYSNKEIMIYEMCNLNKKNSLKLIKNLKKDNIKKLAFEEYFNKYKKEEFEKEFIVINREKILWENIVKIIKKSAKSLGIEKGKLILAVSVDKMSLNIFKKIKSVAKYIKIVYLYCQESTEALAKADEFCEETGIPVILNSKLSEKKDILILKDGELKTEKDCFIIDIENRLDKKIKCVNEIVVNIPKSLNIYNVSDSVIAELFGINFNITGFRRKILDTNG